MFWPLSPLRGALPKAIEFTIGKIWSGHFWYTKFWVQNPLPPSPPPAQKKPWYRGWVAYSAVPFPLFPHRMQFEAKQQIADTEGRRRMQEHNDGLQRDRYACTPHLRSGQPVHWLSHRSPWRYVSWDTYAHTVTHAQVHIVALDGHSIPSLNTVTPYSHSILSLFTVTLYCSSMPSLYTVALYRHCILSLHTVTPYGHSVPSIYTLTLYSHSIPALRIKTYD